jgi:hypothetical protein
MLIAGKDPNDIHTHIQPLPHLAHFTSTDSLQGYKVTSFVHFQKKTKIPHHITGPLTVEEIVQD